MAELAGQQERALRRLVSSADADTSGAVTDLGGLLRRRASDRVSVSLPTDPVLLDANVASELFAAAVNALDNVAAHAGPDAHAFVLLEDLGDSVMLSIRDDGAASHSSAQTFSATLCIVTRGDFDFDAQCRQLRQRVAGGRLGVVGEHQESVEGQAAFVGGGDVVQARRPDEPKRGPLASLVGTNDPGSTKRSRRGWVSTENRGRICMGHWWMSKS